MTGNHDAAADERKRWMSLLARAAPARLAALLPELPVLSYLRPPQIGAVMVQGRVGAKAEPFNLGEMTVTRCSVQLADGAVGHGHVQGRDKGHATRAAVVDALMQTAEAPRLRATVLEVLAAEAAAARRTRAEKAAATRVDFFTLRRGETE